MKKYTKFLAVAALAAAMSSGAMAAGTVSGLQDIDSYWGKSAIEYFYDNHYISGSNGYFYPNDPITRESIASILDNMLGENDTVLRSDFKDVRGRWSERAIASLVDKQIMSGYKDNTFRPTQDITRQEFAVIAYNYMNYKGIIVQDTATPYADEASIAPWAKKAVNTLSAAGYMQGANNYFQPNQKVTRGEAVNVLYRIINNSQGSSEKQNSLQTQVFKDVTDVYGSVKNFAKDGIMYWMDNKLHVGVKTKANQNKLEQVIATDSEIPAGSVIVQRSTYSYNDYKNIKAQAEKIYRATEPTGTAVETKEDYLNERVDLIVPSISKETQAALNKQLGSVLRIVIQ
ncbi:S-layer homology domain-containing protein [uncultured Megasphaera sp.]|uniref:S-layer homology domain-containing protein n=1 Tax=uncultured Megasphaera sp. TaxID=165188 RepID=UPI0025914894|nr:S-layer homology domain-containing protein [uncultured Megasphaera sp.]